MKEKIKFVIYERVEFIWGIQENRVAVFDTYFDAHQFLEKLAKGQVLRPTEYLLRCEKTFYRFIESRYKEPL